MDLAEIYVGLARLVYVSGVMFAYCEMGEQVTSAFEEIEHMLAELDWHLFPSEIQRMMPMLLMVARQPVDFMGYGNLPASRYTMQRVRIQNIFYVLEFSLIGSFSSHRRLQMPDFHII